MPTQAILLIHGLWMTPHSWQPWIERFVAQGHTVHAPAWPGVSQLGEPLDHDKAPAGLGVKEIAEHYEAFLRTLPEQPVIIGHSLGGLVTQILLDRGWGRAGVALHPGQPRGVLGLPLTTLRAAWPVLRNPANLNRTVALTERQFHYAFANTVSAEQAARERATWAIPGPGRPLFQAGLANLTPKARAATYVDYRNDARSPLLLVAGTADRIVPPSLVRENHRRHLHSEAVTEYREHPGRDHGTCFHEGWEQVADESLTWAAQW